MSSPVPLSRPPLILGAETRELIDNAIARRRASSDKGADQWAEEVEAASVGSTRSGSTVVCANLEHHLAQLSDDDSQASLEVLEEPGVGSRKRAHTESGVEPGSQCSEFKKSKKQLALTVPIFPPSTPAAAPQAVTADTAPKRSTSTREDTELLKHKTKLDTAEKNLAILKKHVERERWQFAAAREGYKRRMALQAIHGEGTSDEPKPGTPVAGVDGTEIGYYDPEPDIDRLFVKVWLPRTHLHGWGRTGTMTHSAGWPCRYICLLDAQHCNTIGDLKAKIVAHPDGGMLVVGDVHIFFRGTRLAEDARLVESSIDDDVIVHACTQDSARAVAVASSHLWSWLNLDKISATWQGGATI